MSNNTNRRPSNVKRAARELMAQNPGMSYTEARAKIVAAAANTTPTPPAAPFDGHLTETVVHIAACHVTEQEWVMLTQSEARDNGVFRILPDPDRFDFLGGGEVYSVMVRTTSDLLDDTDRVNELSEVWPTLIPVLQYAVEGGAGWVYFDVDADIHEALPRYDEEATPAIDPASCTESDAIDMMGTFRHTFGWAGTWFMRGDADSLAGRPLTDDEWDTVRNSWEWRKLDEVLTTNAWDLIGMAVLEVTREEVINPNYTSTLMPGESEALAAWHTFKSRFGWTGTFFTRGDAASTIQRDLTDAEWAKVQDSYEWAKVLPDWMGSEGNDVLMDAVSEFSPAECPECGQDFPYHANDCYHVDCDEDDMAVHGCGRYTTPNIGLEG